MSQPTSPRKWAVAPKPHTLRPFGATGALRDPYLSFDETGTCVGHEVRHEWPQRPRTPTLASRTQALLPTLA